jgi:hypothetical protein
VTLDVKLIARRHHLHEAHIPAALSIMAPTVNNVYHTTSRRVGASVLAPIGAWFSSTTVPGTVLQYGVVSVSPLQSPLETYVMVRSSLLP